MRSFSGTRGAPVFFAAQALATAAWWIALLAHPAWRGAFRPAGADDLDLLAFLLPDAASCALALAAALTLWAGHRWGPPLAWASAGATVYAAAYVLAWAALRDGGWLAVLLMVPAATFAAFFALDASPDLLSVFRRARPADPRRHLAATLGWIVAFWTFFLALLPLGIVFVEGRLGVPRFAFPGQRVLAVALFLACSALGLWSGLTMASRGEGTPVPIDGTNRLVAAGPYRILRNPMVVAGLGQGLAVVVGLGSPVGILYVLAGAGLWDRFVRPAEERDLAAKFGEPYNAYRREVRCWVPRARR
jgi:protein-S-isoprenylcysteine O-methyltransferase Ste14